MGATKQDKIRLDFIDPAPEVITAMNKKQKQCHRMVRIKSIQDTEYNGLKILLAIKILLPLFYCCHIVLEKYCCIEKDVDFHNVCTCTRDTQRRCCQTTVNILAHEADRDIKTES